MKRVQFKLAQWMLPVVLMSGFSAHAVFKCTDPKTGKVSYSDAACPSVLNDTKMDWKPNAQTNAVQSQGNWAPGQREGDFKTVPEAAALMDIYRRWSDAEALAGATPRIRLSEPVAKLQDLKRAAQAAQVPACMSKSRDALVNVLTASSDAFIAFMLRDELVTTVYMRVDRPRLVREYEELISRARC